DGERGVCRHRANSPRGPTSDKAHYVTQVRHDRVGFMLMPINECDPSMQGCVPPACGSFSPPENQVQYPHFCTCMRGFCHGPCSLFLSVGAGPPGVAVPHAPVGVAQRPCHCATNTTFPHATPAQASLRAETLCGPHPQTAL